LVTVLLSVGLPTIATCYDELMSALVWKDSSPKRPVMCL